MVDQLEMNLVKSMLAAVAEEKVHFSLLLILDKQKTMQVLTK